MTKSNKSNDINTCRTPPCLCHAQTATTPHMNSWRNTSTVAATLHRLCRAQTSTTPHHTSTVDSTTPHIKKVAHHVESCRTPHRLSRHYHCTLCQHVFLSKQQQIKRHQQSPHTTPPVSCSNFFFIPSDMRLACSSAWRFCSSAYSSTTACDMLVARLERARLMSTPHHRCQTWVLQIQNVVRRVA